MKLAWRSEICALPILFPLSPAASISLPAKSPGGLRNIEPELGYPEGWLLFLVSMSILAFVAWISAALERMAVRRRAEVSHE